LLDLLAADVTEAESPGFDPVQGLHDLAHRVLVALEQFEGQFDRAELAPDVLGKILLTRTPYGQFTGGEKGDVHVH
ncbi:MAG: hypothetical protein AAF441_15030, partial [Pseudomonadota bacterium]